jgi:hypothetical protein
MVGRELLTILGAKRDHVFVMGLKSTWEERLGWKVRIKLNLIIRRVAIQETLIRFRITVAPHNSTVLPCSISN